MKLILLGMAMMGTATVGTTDLFHKAQGATENVTAVYAAAAGINHYGDAETMKEQQAHLYAVAERMAPFAEEFGKANPDELEAFQTALR